MKLKEFKKRFELECFKYNVYPDLVFVHRPVEWNGVTRGDGKEIQINAYYVHFSSDEIVIDTLLHELAHCLKPFEGHSEIWRQKAIEIGGTGIQWALLDVYSPSWLAKWIGSCVKCLKSFKLTGYFDDPYAWYMDHNYSKEQREIAQEGNCPTCHLPLVYYKTMNSNDFVIEFCKKYSIKNP